MKESKEKKHNFDQDKGPNARKVNCSCVYSAYILKPELKTLEWWISGLMLNPLFFLIFRLNITYNPHELNLQIN